MRLSIYYALGKHSVCIHYIMLKWYCSYRMGHIIWAISYGSYTMNISRSLFGIVKANLKMVNRLYLSHRPLSPTNFVSEIEARKLQYFFVCWWQNITKLWNIWSMLVMDVEAKKCWWKCSEITNWFDSLSLTNQIVTKIWKCYQN